MKIDEIIKLECSVTSDEHNIVNGRPHGRLYKGLYFVELAFFDKEEARLIASMLSSQLGREISETLELSEVMYPRSKKRTTKK